MRSGQLSRSLLLFLLFAGMPCAAVSADESIDYLTQIKPILQNRCFGCHGALKQEGKLRLDTAALAIQGGESGAAVQPGDPDSSILLRRVTAEDESDRMPPAHEGEPLTAMQITLLKRWIEAGAAGPADEQPETDPEKHWAFQPILRPEVPQIQSDWVRNPIDAFLARRLQQQGISRQPEAPRIVLLRRLHLDLIGIPPALEEIADCEADSSADWYEQTIRRLLNDPRHGERWARHWMDIWRYSDWWGLGDQLRNSQKHIWHWRDWIVESLNSDTPYDEMIRLMLAADELHPNDLGKLRATGYLARNYWLFNRPQWMEETVEHVSKGFLGLTMNCSRCHDHKYDPLQQTDYYRFRAFFEPYHVRMDVVPGEADLSKDGIPRAFDGLLEEPTYLYIRGDERNPDKSQLITPGVPTILAFSELQIEPVSLPVDAWQPERRPWVNESHISAAKSRVEAAEAALKQLQAASVETHGQLQVAEAALSLAQAELESVERRVKALQAEWSSADEHKRDKVIAAIKSERMVEVARVRHRIAAAELALLQAATDQKAASEKSLNEARDALNAAVAAGEAEVKPEDSYTRFTGAAWTPTRFFSSLKDDPEVKFQPQSSGRRTALASWITDRRNPLTARVAVNHIWMRHMGQPLVPTVFDFGRKGTPPHHPELLDWLASELIDSGWSMKHLHFLITSSSAYRMSSSTAGAEAAMAQDSDNHLWWRRVPIRLESQLIRDSLLALAGTLDPKRGGPSVPVADQATSTRRSLYFFHSNNERNLFLTTFDEALVKDCYRREQSIVPQQALALSNSQLALDSAQQIANRLNSLFSDDETFVRQSFRLMVGITPDPEAVSASLRAMHKWRSLPEGTPETARANFVWVLINHNDFVTLR